MNPAGSPDPAAAPRLRISGVAKRFGATHALRDVSLHAAAGEVHALIGENGAGKSTLMKILSGVHSPDQGSIELDGLPFAPASPHQALRDGVAMIYQELNLAPDLSVRENIVLGREPRRWGRIVWPEVDRIARETLAALDHPDIPITTPVHQLNIAEQQIVEIARSLTLRPRVLIMDEPTSSLTRVDTETLFRVIRRLRDQGACIVYISHFLEECREIADRYTVLRDGRTVARGDLRDTPVDTLIRAMVGRDVAEVYPAIPRRPGNAVLEVSRLQGSPRPRSASFDLREGEVLGIAGLVGAGRTETLRTLFGLDRWRSGTATLDSAPLPPAPPRTRLRQGFGLLSEDRKSEGLLLNRDIADNITLPRLQPVARAGFVRPRAQRDSARRWIERLGIRTAGPDQPLTELSGGNQQKVAIARLLHQDARIFLLDEPTRGIDVGSKAEIYRLIGELAAAGKSIVFVSSYIPELLAVCDRIAVMHRGVVQSIRSASECTEHDLIREATGTPTPTPDTPS